MRGKQATAPFGAGRVVGRSKAGPSLRSGWQFEEGYCDGDGCKWKSRNFNRQRTTLPNTSPSGHLPS